MPDRLLAEFADEDAVASAIGVLRRHEIHVIDAYLPFPSHVVDHALPDHPSRLPIAVFFAGIAAAGGAYFLQWLLVGHLYPLIVGGRPPHFPLAFVIITFEMGVLFASLTAFFATLFAGRLVRLRDHVQGTPGFESATRDRFWIEVAPRGSDEQARRLLVEQGALRIEVPA